MSPDIWKEYSYKDKIDWIENYIQKGISIPITLPYTRKFLVDILEKCRKENKENE